jgi:hypothetical protein
MIAMPVRDALSIARHETAILPWTRGVWVAVTTAVLKYLINPTPPISWDVLLYAGGSAIMCYGIAFIGNFIKKVPTVLGEQIDRLKNQCSALQTQNAALRDELNARTAEQDRLAPIVETFWQLKVAAREIKRQWPSCMFVHQPTNRKHWSPFIGQPETGEANPVTLEKCITWHDTLTAFQRKRQRPLSPSVDFDGTMAFLDKEERIERRMPV